MGAFYIQGDDQLFKTAGQFDQSDWGFISTFKEEASTGTTAAIFYSFAKTEAELYHCAFL
jgi:hypothetical protein